MAATAVPERVIRECARCRHVLVDEDACGWYYQVPLTNDRMPGLTFMDRVYECDGRPHEVSERTAVFVFAECCLLADREPALVVPLTRGHEAFISPGKAELVAAYKWSAQRRDNGLWYAIAYVVGSARGGKPGRYVYMHALVSGGQRVDHRDRNGLNNTDANLRAATTVQNGGNTGKRSGTSSRYKGVTYVARTGRWAAQLHHLGRKTHLGYHATEEEAARVYDDAAVRQFGEFARTNVMLGLLPARKGGG